MFCRHLTVFLQATNRLIKLNRFRNSHELQVLFLFILQWRASSCLLACHTTSLPLSPMYWDTPRTKIDHSDLVHSISLILHILQFLLLSHSLYQLSNRGAPFHRDSLQILLLFNPFFQHGNTEMPGLSLKTIVQVIVKSAILTPEKREDFLAPKVA
jgi:hypothetical protein